MISHVGLSPSRFAMPVRQNRQLFLIAW